jgi:hypothetical protein
LREGARHPTQLANLVRSGAPGGAEQSTQRVVMSKLGGQDAEGNDRRRFQIGHLAEVAFPN